jgi:phosphoglycolate phosphatase-like HAD superfamily hydrolase
MNFVYDFDGVLVDTKTAIKQAWRKVGVNPPKDFWKVPYQEWFTGHSDVYEERNRVFIKSCMHLVRPLPMLEVAQQTGGVILTNGAQERVVAILEKLSVKNCIVKCGLDIASKAKELNAFEQTGIYFDDYWENVLIIRKLTKWNAVHIASQY